MTAGWMCAALGAATVLAGGHALAGGQDENRPPLFFREDWVESPAALPVTQAHVATDDLILSLEGPGGPRVKKSHHDRPADDPYYVWSGDADAPWAVSLRRRGETVDLRGAAAIRWRARQTGFRRLHVVLRLDEDTWIVSDQSDGESGHWRVQEFAIRDLRWRELDIAIVVEGDPVDRPDLSRVRAVGFTDLMRGGGTPASSRLDWIEVYGKGNEGMREQGNRNRNGEQGPSAELMCPFGCLPR